MITAIAKGQLPAFGAADIKDKQVEGIVLHPEFGLKRRPGLPGIIPASTPGKHDLVSVKRKIK